MGLVEGIAIVFGVLLATYVFKQALRKMRKNLSLEMERDAVFCELILTHVRGQLDHEAFKVLCFGAEAPSTHNSKFGVCKKCESLFFPFPTYVV